MDGSFHGLDKVHPSTIFLNSLDDFLGADKGAMPGVHYSARTSLGNNEIQVRSMFYGCYGSARIVGDRYLHMRKACIPDLFHASQVRFAAQLKIFYSLFSFGASVLVVNC